MNKTKVILNRYQDLSSQEILTDVKQRSKAAKKTNSIELLLGLIGYEFELLKLINTNQRGN